MSQDNVALRAYFARVGLEPDIASLYIALHAYGPQGVLQLSRHSGVERTRIYRLLDTLQEASLVEVEVHHKRNIYRAAPILNLQILLSQREEELRHLQAELEGLHVSLQAAHARSPLTHIQFYKGPEGLRQMFWNQTRSSTDNLAILFENMQVRTNAAFFQRWVEKCNKLDINFRGIISDNFIKTQQSWYASRQNERLSRWFARYIPDTTFPITHSTITYDDVVAYYNWKDGEVFGIELYNAEIALAQRHFFEMLWKQGQPVNDLIGPKKDSSDPPPSTPAA